MCIKPHLVEKLIIWKDSLGDGAKKAQNLPKLSMAKYIVNGQYIWNDKGENFKILLEWKQSMSTKITKNWDLQQLGSLDN